MSLRRMLRIAVLAAVILSALGTAGAASAWSGCPAYATVQWGDTLYSIARMCGTTVDAILAANPGLTTYIYAGQVIYIPTGYYAPPPPPPPPGYPPAYPTPGSTYVVQWGDTLGSIAARAGVSVYDLMAANPFIRNPSYIYAGQVITIPAAPMYYTVCRGDTLRIIAARYGTTVYNLQLLNPQIYNINLIYPGQVIRVR